MKTNKGIKRSMIISVMLIVVLSATFVTDPPASEGSEPIPPIVSIFGGNGEDLFQGVAKTNDGYVAVGYYEFGPYYSDGDIPESIGKGSFDALIVKFNFDGEVEWKNNFGGAGTDSFYGVIATKDGYVAVGYSDSKSFNSDGDWFPNTGKGGQDAIIVKFRFDGTLEWKKNFGGKGNDYFSAVAAADDGCVAVGYSESESFEGDGDWIPGTGKGGTDAMIVKFDSNGKVKWNKNFGGKGRDSFYGVAAADNEYVAVGVSFSESFEGDGDWLQITGKGGGDAIIVKFDSDGEVEWKKNFGGNGNERFGGVTEASDGFVAVGDCNEFGNDDWENVEEKGSLDAIIVKFNFDGEVEWKNNFGGSGRDYFHNVTKADEGFVAAGESYEFGTGDWENVTGKGDRDATIVKFDSDGKVEWKKNFGGDSVDIFFGVIETVDGYIAVGEYLFESYDSVGDWPEGVDKLSFNAVLLRLMTKSTVRYEADGGYGTVVSESKDNGTTITLPSVDDFQREGYILKGWATSSGGEVVYVPGGSYTINENVTLYAVWEIENKIADDNSLLMILAIMVLILAVGMILFHLLRRKV